MESFSPIASLQNLKLTAHETTFVFPPKDETLNKSTFLSNSDLFINDYVRTAQFFKAKPDFPFEDVAKRVKVALEKILVPYHFMAGRLKWNTTSARPELDCNEAGDSFAVASSQISLDDIRDCLVCPNSGFRQLVVRSYDTFASLSDRPLLFVQVTSFACGGFALGFAIYHFVLDGMGIKVFLDNLASQAFDGNKPLDVVPLHNRELLAARCPPVVAFPHTEYSQHIINPNHQESSASPPPNVSCENLEVRVFKFSTSQIAELKNEARNTANATTRISSFGVVAALLWRCKALSKGQGCKKDKISKLVFAMDIRGRINPPLPMSYSANAILPKAVSATHKELESKPLGELVERIVEGTQLMTSEYAKSALDWLEVYKGFVNGDIWISSWLMLGFEQVVYPWGKPIYSCPIVYYWPNLCVIFPDAIDGGTSVMMALDAQEMEIFEARLRKFFE